MFSATRQQNESLAECQKGTITKEANYGMKSNFSIHVGLRHYNFRM